MKREKLITRTIISTKANCKVFLINAQLVIDEDITFTGKLEGKELDNACREYYEKDNVNAIKFIMVNSVETIEKLYGVTESEFMAIAKELPPRKVNETQEEE